MLAIRDPARALSLALAPADEEWRHVLLRAVLRGWARADVDAAGAWALSQSELEQGDAFAAVFAGAVRRPDEAVRFADRISRGHPAQASAYGEILIRALGEAGEYENAVRFAAEDNPDFASDRLSAAYRQWSEHAPETAALSAMTTSDPALRLRAVESVVGVWSQSDPHALAESARGFSAGPERTLALTVALRAWTEKDFEAAWAWVEHWQPTGALASVDLKLVLDD